MILQFSGQVFSVELNPSALSDADAGRAGLRPLKDWRAFGLKGYGGSVLNKAVTSITIHCIYSVSFKAPKVLIFMQSHVHSLPTNVV